MELFEAFSKRHSYRGPFKDQAINRDDLQKIVHAGLIAPSGKNEQTTEFIIIDDKSTLEHIRAMHPTNKAMQQAKAMIACLIDKNPEAVYEGYQFQVEDCAAAVENMLLAITALGYASVWIDGWLRVENRADKIGKLLNLPAGKIIRILLPIGVAAEEKHQPKKKSFQERAWFNCYPK